MLLLLSFYYCFQCAVTTDKRIAHAKCLVFMLSRLERVQISADSRNTRKPRIRMSTRPSISTSVSQIPRIFFFSRQIKRFASNVKYLAKSYTWGVSPQFRIFFFFLADTPPAARHHTRRVRVLPRQALSGRSEAVNTEVTSCKRARQGLRNTQKHRQYQESCRNAKTLRNYGLRVGFILV